MNAEPGSLPQLGWRPEFESALQALPPGLVPARVATQHRRGYRVYCERGELAAEISGRLRHVTRSPADLPAVGDWVAVEAMAVEAKCVIQAVLPRRTKFSRTAPGGMEAEQVLAANIDDAVVVATLSSALNLRRIERYVAMAWESGADPMVVLTKADLCADPEAASRQVSRVVGGIAVYAVSSQTGFGMADLQNCLRPGRTLVLLGPSGVGKSTLINCWCGEPKLAVQAVRESDQKGRHTTTRRQLIRLPSGALVIDTPGLRELQLWEGAQGVEETFADVAELAARCRFTDCRHENEPGCAVQEALRNGGLEPARFESHQKLCRELAYFERRHNKQAQAQLRQRFKAIHKQFRSTNKNQ